MRGKFIFIVFTGLLGIFLNTSGQVIINEVLTSNTRTNYDSDFGEFSDWIELKNTSDVDIDISNWNITDDRDDLNQYTFPLNTIIPSNGYLLLWADNRDLNPGDKAMQIFSDTTIITVKEYHLNFRLNSDYEKVYLSNPNGLIIDSLIIESQIRDISFGKSSTNSNVYFSHATPLMENAELYKEIPVFADSVEFSLVGGLYNSGIELTLSSPEINSEIRYTLDGSQPNSNSFLYTGAIAVNYTQTIKARVYASDKLPGEVLSETYIIGNKSTLPVVSLSTDHKNMFGFDFGIYQNSLKNREIPVHIELFESSGNKAFGVDAGVELFGSQIYTLPQKPFSVILRNRFGTRQIEYQLFNDKQNELYSNFVLRNGGNDNALTMLRDGFGASVIAGELDVDYQAYQPAVVYLNGDYYGIYNIREKLNSRYLEDNHSVNPDYIDLLEDQQKVNDGSKNNYEELMTFVSENDLSNDDNFQFAGKFLDMDEYMDYMILKIYAGYRIWSLNKKYWRSRHDGKWRWIAFDLEHGFGGPGGDPYDGNSLVHALEPNKDNPEWSLLLFQKLMSNDEFKSEFLQRTAVYLNTVFSRKRLQFVLDSLQQKIENEISKHIFRWQRPMDLSAWQFNIGVMENFISNREDYIHNYFMDYYSISDTSLFIVDADEGGYVEICNYMIDNPPFQSYFFDGVDITLKAIPKTGYRFSSWSNGNTSNEIKVKPDEISNLVATFEPYTDNVIEDTIKGKVTLDETHSPYVANHHIYIPAGDSLIVEAGVEIRLHPGASIIVDGTLELNGSADKNIIVDVDRNGIYQKNKPEENLKWGAIMARNSTGKLIVSGTQLLNGSHGTDKDKYKAVISTFRTDALLQDVMIPQADLPVFCHFGSVEIRDCFFHSRAAGDLIHLKNTGNSIISGCQLKGNFAEDADAIDLDSVTNVQVMNNHVYAFYGFNSDGIDMGESSLNVQLSDNVISDCFDKGISVGQGSSVYAQNNMITNCLQGVGVKDDLSYILSNQNTFYENNLGIASFEKNRGDGGGNATVVNTIFSQSTEASVFVDSLSSLEVTYSLSDNDSLPHATNYYDDPQFTNASHFDFSLLENSICIDNGNPQYRDEDGSIADIGASGNSFTMDYGIIISEINYNSSDSLDSGDWIELYNYGEVEIDLSRWIIKDGNPESEYVFPLNTILSPKEYLVIGTSRDKLLKTHQIEALGNFNFRFSGDGEAIRLYNNNYQLVHMVRYNDNNEWGELADGNGATLEIIEGVTDNSKPGSWQNSSVPGGTPGKSNSTPELISGLYINEIMALNNTTVVDEFGEFDDWIEIYNSNDYPVNVGGLAFISNRNSDNLQYIPIAQPELTEIPGYGHAILWADNDSEQGVKHLDFKLSASGENIYLVQRYENEIIVIDSASYTALQADQALGRYHDGENNWQLVHPTPGSENTLTSIPHEEITPEIEIYPNPASDNITIKNIPEGTGMVQIAIYDMSGRKVLNHLVKNYQGSTNLNVSSLKAGAYRIIIRNTDYAVSKSLVIIR